MKMMTSGLRRRQYFTVSIFGKELPETCIKYGKTLDGKAAATVKMIYGRHSRAGLDSTRLLQQ